MKVRCAAAAQSAARARHHAACPRLRDVAYWPDMPDKRAASCWVALDDAHIDNGCMVRGCWPRCGRSLAAAAPMTARCVGAVVCAGLAPWAAAAAPAGRGRRAHPDHGLERGAWNTNVTDGRLVHLPSRSHAALLARQRDRCVAPCVHCQLPAAGTRSSCGAIGAAPDMGLLLLPLPLPPAMTMTPMVRARRGDSA